MSTITVMQRKEMPKMTNSPPARMRGRPKSDNKKTRIGIRLTTEVVEFFRADGPGWQTRVDDVLRAYVNHHTNSRGKVL